MQPKPAQPYFLNHLRGHVRLRQAALRAGAAAGPGAGAGRFTAPSMPVAPLASAGSVVERADGLPEVTARRG